MFIDSIDFVARSHMSRSTVKLTHRETRSKMHPSDGGATSTMFKILPSLSSRHQRLVTADSFGGYVHQRNDPAGGLSIVCQLSRLCSTRGVLAELEYGCSVALMD